MLPDLTRTSFSSIRLQYQYTSVVHLINSAFSVLSRYISPHLFRLSLLPGVLLNNPSKRNDDQLAKNSNAFFRNNDNNRAKLNTGKMRAQRFRKMINAEILNVDIKALQHMLSWKWTNIILTLLSVLQVRRYHFRTMLHWVIEVPSVQKETETIWSENNGQFTTDALQSKIAFKLPEIRKSCTFTWNVAQHNILYIFIRTAVISRLPSILVLCFRRVTSKHSVVREFAAVPWSQLCLVKPDHNVGDVCLNKISMKSRAMFPTANFLQYTFISWETNPFICAVHKSEKFWKSADQYFS